MTGVVASVDIAVGGRVSAGTTSSVITIIGKNQYQVTTTIPLSVIDKVKVGQSTAVTVNGQTTPVSGTVAMIGVLNASGSGSTASYPVTVALEPKDGTKLFDGTGASIAVTVGDVDGVLTVPTSAVHAATSGYTVTVLKDGVATETPVEIGSVGTTLTEITGGLKSGDQVVLADLSAAIPTSTANNSRFGRVNAGSGSLLGGSSAGAGVVVNGGAGFGPPPG
jgi:hypothetical protein